MSVEIEVQEIIDRETKAWTEKSTDLLLSVFHPYMVWVWPADTRNYDPMSWFMPQGKFDKDKCLKIYSDWFSKFNLIHNRRLTQKPTMTIEND